jgi:predicted CoA-binding protein
MNIQEQIDKFLSASAFAVIGASENAEKYGYKCYRCYLDNDKQVYPINPTASTICGHKAFPSLQSLPEPVQSITIVTPPAVTAKVVDEAIAAGVKNIWMQPGAENQEAIAAGRAAGLNVIANGPCILVQLGWSDTRRPSV